MQNNMSKYKNLNNGMNRVAVQLHYIKEQLTHAKQNLTLFILLAFNYSLHEILN